MTKQLVILALFFGLTATAAADPKILIPDAKWDFGHIPQKSKVTHDYLVKNVGTDTLRILRVKPG